MTTQLKPAYVEQGSVANLTAKPTVTAVIATDSNWTATASGNLDANTTGYIEIQGRDFNQSDRVMIDLFYVSTSITLANSQVIRAQLGYNIPAGTRDVYVIKSNGNYSIKTNSLTHT
jgi:hypothetical protein